MRLSTELVLKSKGAVSKAEAETQRFAAAQGYPVPKVHRVLFRKKDTSLGLGGLWYIVMDYVPGKSLDDLWPCLDDEQRESVVDRVVRLVNRMQSETLPDGTSPGPVDYDPEKPWQGPFLTDYGAGPFTTTQEMEDWFNHKRDVCHKLNQAGDCAPIFEFHDLVLTHHDIAPRNVIVNEETLEVSLIDWQQGGLYPPGFEQAALGYGGPGEWDDEFCQAVLAKLWDPAQTQRQALQAIMYGLTTGAFL